MVTKKVYDQEGHFHYLTFSCYRRRNLLSDNLHKKIVIGIMGTQLAKQKGGCIGFVVMPDHVHTIVRFDHPGQVSHFMKQWKQMSSRRIKKNMRDNYRSYTLGFQVEDPVWQRRYYDFNIYSERKMLEKLDYMHGNPVRAGMVRKPEDWYYGSARWYELGKSVGVKIDGVG